MNAAAPVSLDPADRLKITETFYSLQGEADASGWPSFFIRLTGCPLRCVYCDTEYAFHGGRRMTLAEIVAEVEAVGTPLVEITGGEPLAHPNAFPLAATLADRGFTVLVETSGAFDISPLDPRVHRIMDLKCPGSGEVDRNLWSNLEHLGPDAVPWVKCNLISPHAVSSSKSRPAPVPGKYRALL